MQACEHALDNTLLVKTVNTLLRQGLPYVNGSIKQLYIATGAVTMSFAGDTMLLNIGSFVAAGMVIAVFPSSFKKNTERCWRIFSITCTLP